MTTVRALLDPDYARRLGLWATFEAWLADAEMVLCYPDDICEPEEDVFV